MLNKDLTKINPGLAAEDVFTGNGFGIFPFVQIAFCPLPYLRCMGTWLELNPNEEMTMGKRDELIAKYAEDLKSKCGMDAGYGSVDQSDHRLWSG